MNYLRLLNSLSENESSSKLTLDDILKPEVAAKFTPTLPSRGEEGLNYGFSSSYA